MRFRLRRTTVLACIAASLAIAAGGAVAATGLGSDDDQQAVLDDAAQRLGVSPQKLSDALRGAIAARIDDAVKAGTLSPEDGARLKQKSADGPLPFAVPGTRKLGEWGHEEFGEGPPGIDKAGGLMFGPGPEGLEPAAAYLGLSREELQAQLNSGKTLRQVAKAQGKPVAGLLDVFVTGVKAKLARGVAASDLTEAEAADMLAEARKNAEMMLDAGIRIEEHSSRVDGFKGECGDGMFGPGPKGLEPAAEFLGLSREELQTQLNSGKTLAEVAKAHGKSKAELVGFMLAGVKPKLDGAVAAGDLTGVEAAEMLTVMRAKTEAMVDEQVKMNECDRGLEMHPKGGGVPVPVPAEPDASLEKSTIAVSIT